MLDNSKIRNIAIIAHIDHGKTTLVDFLLKQAHTFRENSEEMGQDLIMDSGELERERGITIMAKNAAINYKDYKINIIDTPGHADFGGEVERTLNMADGVLLLVDAQEGPMPQTRVVLQKALQLDLKPIVIINKIDKPASRVAEVEEEINSLFLELAHHESQLDFPVLYAVGRAGQAFEKIPLAGSDTSGATLEVLFEKIISYIPAPKGNAAEPLQILITSLDYDDFKGTYAIGRIARGTVKAKTAVVVVDPKKGNIKGRIENVFTWQGLKRQEVTEAAAGDIVALTGLNGVGINATVCDPEKPEPLPLIAIEEPTLKILIGPNTSPFVGQDGALLTGRQIQERLEKEMETNVSMRLEIQNGKFLVSGRGELHLSILLETLRRESFELEVAKPQVITKIENGAVLEPWEEVLIDTPEKNRGIVLAELAKRKAQLADTFPHANDVRFVYNMPTQAMLGLRSALITLTRGSFVLSSRFIEFKPKTEAPNKTRKGVLIAHEAGSAVAFGLEIAQGRGVTFVEPGTAVYEGMIVGENSKEQDIEINVCKGKQLTNMRSKGSDGMIQLAPAVALNLEQSLDFLENDELLEITPRNLRLRKKYLTKNEREKKSVK
ncbi:MAG: translational GTPase TypA [Parcubacteria group bacterium]|nr:translational GTPase TypA [Parcubacteria group bacterium]